MNSRIQQRLREHMDALFLTIGGILIPLGFYLKIEQSQLDGVGTAAVLAGLVAWLAAYYFVNDKRKKEQRERVEQRADLHKLFTDTHQLLSDIHQELKRLNESKNGQT